MSILDMIIYRKLAGVGGVSSVNGKTGVVVLTPSDIGIGTVFNLKGSKPTIDDLPSTGNQIGDVWYVVAESVGYIWLNDGTVDRWEQLGVSIDLSSYAEKTWVENKGYQTSTQVETAITGKGYQTSEQVEAAITGKGYQTSSQVENAITGKGYQTSAQVDSAIATAIGNAIGGAY